MMLLLLEIATECNTESERDACKVFLLKLGIGNGCGEPCQAP